MGEGLDGFSEAHVVGENAMKAVGGEKLQPAVALCLIGPQLGAQAAGDLRRGQAGEMLEAVAQLREGAGGLGRVEGKSIGHSRGGESVHAQRPVRRLAVEEVADLLDHFHQAGGREAHEAILGILTSKREILGKIRRIHGGKIHADRLGDDGNEADPLAL